MITIDVRWVCIPLITWVTNTETISIAEWFGKIDFVRFGSGLKVIHVV